MAALGTRGYRPISLSVYGTPAAPFYAAVWIKRDGPDWQPFNDLDVAQYQKVYDLLTAQGYRPTILSATGSGSAAISIMWSFPPGVQTYGMTRGWYKDSWKHRVNVYSHPGGFPGSCSLIFRRSDNISCALFFNKDALEQPASLMNQLNTLVDAAKWPDGDLFPSLGIPTFSQ